MPTTDPVNAVDKPIRVSKSAGIIDTLTAAGRYATVVATSIPILMTLLGSRNFAGFLEYFQGSDGNQLIAAIGGLGALAYGLFKSFKRGAEVATVAADDRVPNSVAQLK